jgi:hypothetical protein
MQVTPEVAHGNALQEAFADFAMHVLVIVDQVLYRLARLALHESHDRRHRFAGPSASRRSARPGPAWHQSGTSQAGVRREEVDLRKAPHRGHWLVQRRTCFLPVGKELGDRVRVHHRARQDVRAGLRTLLERDHRDVGAVLHGQLLEPNRGRLPGRAGSDNHDVILHRLARAELLQQLRSSGAIGHHVTPPPPWPCPRRPSSRRRTPSWSCPCRRARCPAPRSPRPSSAC